MRHARHPIPAHKGTPSLLARAIGAFRPSRLVRCPMVFTTVLLALSTGIFGLGDLIAGGLKPLAVLEMSGTYWLVALLANLIDMLAEGNGARRH